MVMDKDDRERMVKSKNKSNCIKKKLNKKCDTVMINK